MASSNPLLATRIKQQRAQQRQQQRNEDGLYRVPGSVPMNASDEAIASVWAAVFKFEPRQDRRGSWVTTPAKEKPICSHHDQQVRQCGRCKTRYCDLCRGVVHNSCPKGAS